MNVIEKFYLALQHLDYKTMQSCYDEQATFHDPMFGQLNAHEVKAMWQMLCQKAENFSMEYKNVVYHGKTGSCDLVAHYTFSQTKRKVTNRIHSTFILKGDKILQQNDDFSFWKWSRQALGLPGLLLGWFPPFQNKVSGAAQQRLKKFIEKHPEL